MVSYVVKMDFLQIFVGQEKTPIACAARDCGLSSECGLNMGIRLPKQARYQLRYTRLFCSADYSTKVVRCIVNSSMWLLMGAKMLRTRTCWKSKTCRSLQFNRLSAFAWAVPVAVLPQGRCAAYDACPENKTTE